MSTNSAFFTMLQITDSVFPIGSYTQSNGLETYVQKGLVKDVETSENYIRSVLKNSYMYSDFLAVKLAYEYAELEAYENIIEVDQLLSASKAAREMKEGSSKLCLRFLKLVNRFSSYDLVEKYRSSIENGECMGQHSIVYGIFSAKVNINKEDAIRAYVYNTASSIVNNCAKLIPLGQADGQVILFKVQDLFENIMKEIEKLTIEDIGRCCIGFDIRAMQHEELYSRLYMS